MQAQHLGAHHRAEGTNADPYTPDEAAAGYTGKEQETEVRPHSPQVQAWCSFLVGTYVSSPATTCKPFTGMAAG